ncbi:MAG: M23 family metallopeptidase [Desulfobacteraceae bacterium]|nr:M23 family metallopeptidase [Desulfobacteraceae bacterium]
MSKQFNILIIDNKGSRIKKANISMRSVAFFTLLFLLAATAIAFGSFHYYMLKKTARTKPQLLSQLALQKTQIQRQRIQIQAFADKINKLKTKLVSLNDFEKKIRIMANLEHKANQLSILAAGGSMPDDLDSNMPLNQNHGRLIRKMHEQIKQVNQSVSSQKTNLGSLLDSLNDKRNLLAATPSLRPTTGWVSSNFGYRISPFTGQKEFHRGLDIATKKGTPVIAPADGIISYAGKKWLMGNMLKINHDYGMTTRYGHLSKLLKRKGEKVKRGELVALVGNTGRSTGPHLHYEVRLNGVPVNPAKYILN